VLFLDSGEKTLAMMVPSLKKICILLRCAEVT
jgi:hypothetical protein